MDYIKLKNNAIINVRFLVSVDRNFNYLHFHLIDNDIIDIEFKTQKEAIEALEKFYEILEVLNK